MKELFIRPAEQRVVVLPIESKERTTESGIIIPIHVEDNTPEIAIVIAVGNGDKNDPMLYNIGQKVIYSQYSGVEIKLNILGANGVKTYKVMNQLDIMAVVEEAN